MPSIVMAIRLRDRTAVCLTRDGGWSERIDESRRAATEAEAAALLAAAERAVADRIVAAPHLVEIGPGEDYGNVAVRGAELPVCAAYWAY